MKFVSQVVPFFRYILSVFIRVHLWFPSFSFRVVGVFRGLNFRIMELGPGGGALTKVGQCVSPVGVSVVPLLFANPREIRVSKRSGRL